jgi:hypothetical protein
MSNFVATTRALMEQMSEAQDKPVDKAHFCATHVEHHTFGPGTCISEAHAEPDADGNIAWYTVQFADGVRKMNTTDMKITMGENHLHSKKKPMKEEETVGEANIKHPNQQKLDVHEPEKDELTAKDFEMLRKGKKVEKIVKDDDDKDEMKENVELVDIITTYEMTEQVAIPQNPTFQNYLDAIKSIVNDDSEEVQKEIITLAQEAFANKEIDVLIKAELQAMNEAGTIKMPTATGMKVMGTRYGNSAEAERNRTKKFVDTLSGPGKKAMDKLEKSAKAKK